MCSSIVLTIVTLLLNISLELFHLAKLDLYLPFKLAKAFFHTYWVNKCLLTCLTLILARKNLPNVFLCFSLPQPPPISPVNFHDKLKCKCEKSYHQHDFISSNSICLTLIFVCFLLLFLYFILSLFILYTYYHLFYYRIIKLEK